MKKTYTTPAVTPNGSVTTQTMSGGGVSNEAKQKAEDIGSTFYL